MKIYTKTGDKGETALIGGQRTSKIDIRIETIGAVDELNAHIGLAHAMLSSELSDVAANLLQIQHRLFDVGAILANLSEKKGRSVTVPEITTKDVAVLEEAIDRYDTELTQLTAFILPGGSQAASTLHVARAVCRRAERRLVALQDQFPFESAVLKYINRLSDFLFTVARLANRRTDRPDIFWQKDEPSA